MGKVKKILLCALLLASIIVLGRFLSIRTPILTIGFSFVPLMLVAIILGWKYSALIGMLSDLIGALLFPIGPYFIGFTISNLLVGVIHGLFLHKKGKFKVDKKFLFNLIISTSIVAILISGLLNTYWIFMIVKDATKIVMSIRILKAIAMIPIQVITMYFLAKVLEKRINDFKENSND